MVSLSRINWYDRPEIPIVLPDDSPALAMLEILRECDRNGADPEIAWDYWGSLYRCVRGSIDTSVAGVYALKLHETERALARHHGPSWTD